MRDAGIRRDFLTRAVDSLERHRDRGIVQILGVFDERLIERLLSDVVRLSLIRAVARRISDRKKARRLDKPERAERIRAILFVITELEFRGRRADRDGLQHLEEGLNRGIIVLFRDAHHRAIRRYFVGVFFPVRRRGEVRQEGLRGVDVLHAEVEFELEARGLGGKG